MEEFSQSVAEVANMAAEELAKSATELKKAVYPLTKWAM